MMTSRARALRIALLTALLCFLMADGVDAARKPKKERPERKRTKPVRKPKKAPKPKATEETDESGEEDKSKAAKPPKPRTGKSTNVVKASGKLTVTKDGAGKITEITFTTEDGKTYSAWLDKKSEGLGGLHGKTVEVVGLLCEKEGKTWMKIGRCIPIQKKPPSPKVSTAPVDRGGGQKHLQGGVE